MKLKGLVKKGCKLAQFLHALWVLCSEHHAVFLFAPEGKIKINLPVAMVILLVLAICHHGEILIKLNLWQKILYNNMENTRNLHHRYLQKLDQPGVFGQLLQK